MASLMDARRAVCSADCWAVWSAGQWACEMAETWAAYLAVAKAAPRANCLVGWWGAPDRSSALCCRRCQ